MEDDAEYELLPHEQVLHLRKEIERLKSNPLIKEHKDRELLAAVNNLNTSIKKLYSLFESVNEEILKDYEQGESDEKMDKILAQNKQIAEGLLTIADNIHPDEESEEEKTQPQVNTKPEVHDEQPKPEVYSEQSKPQTPPEFHSEQPKPEMHQVPPEFHSQQSKPQAPPEIHNEPPRSKPPEVHQAPPQKEKPVFHTPPPKRENPPHPEFHQQPLRPRGPPHPNFERNYHHSAPQPRMNQPIQSGNTFRQPIPGLSNQNAEPPVPKPPQSNINPNYPSTNSMQGMRENPTMTSPIDASMNQAPQKKKKFLGLF